MDKRPGRPKGTKLNKRWAFRIEDSNFRKLQTISSTIGLPVSKIIRELIIDFIEKFETSSF